MRRRSVSALPVLVRLQLELAAGLSKDSDFRQRGQDLDWAPLQLNHWDKLPFTVHCAILFQVGFEAGRFTVHFHLIRTQWGRPDFGL